MNQQFSTNTSVFLTDFNGPYQWWFGFMFSVEWTDHMLLPYFNKKIDLILLAAVIYF